jgi:hypothetical protein
MLSRARLPAEPSAPYRTKPDLRLLAVQNEKTRFFHTGSYKKPFAPPSADKRTTILQEKEL